MFQARGEVVYDRFGYAYSVNDLIVPTNSYFLDCNLGSIEDFNILIVPYTDQNQVVRPTYAEQQVICAVFTYLSEQIDRPAGGLPATIEFKFDPSMIGTPIFGLGTTFYDFQCGVAEAYLQGQLNLGLHNFQGALHGKIMVNPEPVFYTELDLTPAIQSTEVDLYTIILHEVMHCLGFGSLIGADGNPTHTEGYSNWDLHLQKNASTPLILANAGNSECCATYTFNSGAFPTMPSDVTTCGNVKFDNDIQPTNINAVYPGTDNSALPKYYF